MELTLTRENPDGSADFDLQLTCVEVQQIVRVGLIEVLKRTIEEGKQYECSEASVGDTGSGEPSCAYGPCVKSGKSEQPCYCSEVTQVPY
ncbi:hypothetical protein UFOVP176_57 [uncultured Caudovirales phage]|uniref:Uncharacterized protein n=1 Tax=uncultured Caudovirales phage TaxID=2100421 RepID=A0A6J7WJA9_9CAUD|nr:hypothetical protein UFOVP176_57 [uncultured Caudovirales phage]